MSAGEEIVRSTRDKMQKTVAHAKEEMSHIRTGKANSAMLDAIKVEYYGSPMPLKQVATVTVADAKTLSITPFDKTALVAIEKAILASDLGLTPQNDGKLIRLPIPMLTSQRREELVKIVRKYAEESRVAVRNLRRDANDHIKKVEKAGEVSEDESKRFHDQVQKDTDHFITEIDNLLKVREAEIRED